MSSHFDDMYASAIARGERNQRAIRLIKAHCSHARVELSDLHGFAPLETMVGLPISVREMRCEHAPAPVSIATDLLEGAVSFYEQNCAGCPHRDPQSLPNLKSVAEKEIDRRRAEATACAASGEAAEEQRVQRAAQRAEGVAGEPPATRAMIALLDGVDADARDDRGAELEDLCRLQPELCTPVAAGVLLEVAAEHPSEELFRALDHLDSAGRLNRANLLTAVLTALTSWPVKAAGRLLVKFESDLTSAAIRPALSSILYIAAPASMFPGSSPVGEVDALRVAKDVDLPGVLDELRAMIGADDEYVRRVGAGAAGHLLAMEPSTASVLVRPLMDALSLPGSMSAYFGSPRGDILAALFAGLCSDPAGTSAAMEDRGRVAGDEVRGALFNVYAMAIRPGRRAGKSTPNAAADAALAAAFARLDGDWGHHVAVEAARLIAMAAKLAPESMSGRVDELFGVLILQVSRPVDEGFRSRLRPAMSEQLAALELANHRNARAAVVRELREALGHLVPSAPEAMAHNVMTVIEAPEFESEEAKGLRDEAVDLLGDLGQHPELLAEVVPALWSSLVHSDQRVRARAVTAWQRIAVRGHRLPSELGELLPSLLADRYVIVHRTTISALRNGLPVGDGQLAEAISTLWGWAQTYLQKDQDVLDDVVQVLWSLAARLPTGPQSALREHCLQFAEHLDCYDKERLLSGRARGSEDLPSFSARLLEVLSDRKLDRTNRDDALLRQLRELDGVRLAALAPQVSTAATSLLPDDPWEAQRFGEVLQRAGDWAGAIALAEKIRDSMPDDQEHAVTRRGAEALVALFHAEMLLQGAETGNALAALDRAAAALGAQQAAADKLPNPWESA